MLPRTLVGSLVLVLLALVAAGTRATDAGEAALRGDVNCGGSVDSIDSLQILRSTAGLSTNAECLAEAGDVDCDGDADSTDSLRILRYVASLSVAPVEGCTPIGEPLEGEIPPTSEALIAAALEADEITYEESLLYRAWALYADERLPAEYASPVMNWEAGTALFGEIDDNIGAISPGVYKQLQEFLARPNDPASIHYDTPPQAVGVTAQGAAWQTTLVPGTNARVWAFGPSGAEEAYVDVVSAVWSQFLLVFAYPNPDQAGDPDLTANPDDAIDFYFVNPAVDPRAAACSVPNPDPRRCRAAGIYGSARRALPHSGNGSSGYLLVNAGMIGGDPLADDELVDTVAHELAHASQFAYDKSEASWLYESTATWVAYRVLLDMNRVPEYAYGVAEIQYMMLDEPLTNMAGDNPGYRSWIFFQHAAMVAGDSIVSSVWDEAAEAGEDGINAVNRAFPLDTHFDDFTVRNWNKKPPIPIRYKDAPDPTFPDSLEVKEEELARNIMVSGEADYTLDLPVEPLSARYYRYEFGSGVRHIIFENNLVQTEGAHVWLLTKIAGDWKPPVPMEGSPVQTWCRDATAPFEEDLEELIVIVSNSKTTGPALEHPDPRVIADPIACKWVWGSVKAILDVESDTEDVRYTTQYVPLRFKPWDVQDTPGTLKYDLARGSGPVVWTASGTVDGCPAEGEASVTYGGERYTGAEPAAGTLVAIAPGDNHSLIVTAWNPVAELVVTCPGDPEPVISKLPFDAFFLLNVLGWPNSATGALYQGVCTLQLSDDQTYTFEWVLGHSAARVKEAQHERAIGPAGLVPDCFDIPDPPGCPPVCPRDAADAASRRRLAD